MKKKALSVLLALCMVLTMFPIMGISSFAETSGDFKYTVLSEEDKTCEITKYTGSATDLTIPSKIDGYTVISIGDFAFLYRTSLTSVTIPNSVVSIKGSVFSHCTSLTNITIPDSVTSIGGGVFKGCDSLNSIFIPNSVSVLNYGIFSECTALKSINISNDNPNYKSIDGVLFTKDGTTLLCCPGGKAGSYRIPDGVTCIEWNAFSYCTSLTSVHIPDSVTEIKGHAFKKCISLTNINIPHSITRINDSTFYKCESLTNIDIPNSVTRIDSDAFYGCTSLTSVTIPNSVKIIYGQSLGFYQGPNYSLKIDGFTIHGFKGSAAEEYANEYAFTFIPFEEVNDSKTNISITETQPGAIPENAQLMVENTENTKTSATYDITLVKDGAVVQPTAPVTIKIPVPETMNGADCKVYRQEANGTYTDMQAIYQNGYMVFTTDHFSVYMLTTNDPNVPAVTIGDVNGDGEINAVDARWILQSVSGARTLSEEQRAAADVNRDGEINAVDARWVLQVVSGARVL